ncbi:MAG: hypothetical protein KIT18_05115 [Burkholderiales bacterium]|nr:hypothetical protein [Burkholderiales bacterium]
MNLLRALATVSGMTLLSRILGFVRDFVIARAFGAGMATDAFFVAFRLPNLLRRLFAEGAFSQAFVPVLAASKARDGEAATRRLIDQVATALAWALLATCVVGVLAAPLLVLLLAGFALTLVAIVVMALLVGLLVVLGSLVSPALGALLAAPVYLAFLLILYVVMFGVMYHLWRDVCGEPAALPDGHVEL